MYKLNKKYSQNSQVLILLLLVSVLLVSSIFYHRGGYAHPEIQNYLPHYLSDRPLLNIIYDSSITDNGAYQARELSYLFDYFDNKFIELSIYYGFPHFLSISHYIFCALIALSLWTFGKKDLSVNPILVIVLIGIFLSSPSIFLGGVYFRSSKIGFALIALLTLRLIFLALRNSYKNLDYQPTKASIVGLFLLCFLGSLFDRQGFYFIFVYLGIIGLWLIFFYKKNLLNLVYIIGLAILVSSLYNHYFAPWVTYLLNGYHPNFDYQRMSIKELFPHDHKFYFFHQGAELYAKTLGNVFGGIPPYILIAASSALSLTGIYFIKKKNFKINKLIIYSISLIYVYSALVIIMFSIMVFRHPPLIWPDVSSFYYWIPAATIFVMSTLLCISAANPRYSTFFVLVFLIIFSLNIINIPNNNYYLENGHLKDFIAEGPTLLSDIKHIKDKEYIPATQTANTKIYQFFIKKYKN